MDFLKSEVSKMKGYLVGIGISDSLNDLIQKNDNITKCDLLEENLKKGKKNFKISGRRKKVNIKKFRKFFKKKKVDNIICNYKTIKNFYKYFVKDSIYICKGTIYIKANKEDKMFLKEKYLRYTTNIEEKDDILVIHSNDTKTNKLKDTIYFIKDSFNEFIDILSLILSN